MLHGDGHACSEIYVLFVKHVLLLLHCPMLRRNSIKLHCHSPLPKFPILLRYIQLWGFIYSCSSTLICINNIGSWIWKHLYLAIFHYSNNLHINGWLLASRMKYSLVMFDPCKHLSSALFSFGSLWLTDTNKTSKKWKVS